MLVRPIARASIRSSIRPLIAPRASQLIFSSYRNTSTQTTSHDEALEILKRQRANRPVSPHLSIYQPQLTWYLSSAHRITGVALTGAFYAFMFGYIGLPLVGLPFDSNSLVTAFGALPIIPKIAIKFLAAVPFTFHSFNGTRHLIWDTAHELTLKGVYRTGYTVLGLTLVSSLILAVI